MTETCIVEVVHTPVVRPGGPLAGVHEVPATLPTAQPTSD
jgi:hypothetical protein